MQPDRKKLEWISNRTGFRINPLEKVIRLTGILNDVFTHPVLSEALVLKGGTALNLFYGPPRRISVDLDFNYIGSLDRTEMLSRRGEVERLIENICTGSGYTLQRSGVSHAGRKFYLGYTNSSGTQDRIEIDINFLHRQLLLPHCKLLSWQLDEDTRCTAKLVSFEELTAGKICAAFDRTSPRDLYDALRLAEIAGEKMYSSLFRSIIITYAGTLPKPLYDYTCELVMKRISQDQFNTSLLPMLIESDQLKIESLKKDAWDVLKKFTDLNDGEREFIHGLQSGELLPELIFPDNKPMQQLIMKHPPLLWKVQNAKTHHFDKNAAAPEA